MEQRNTARIPIQLRAWVRCGRGPFQRAQTVDLSWRGASVELDSTIFQGTHLWLTVKLDGSAPVSVMATVVWTQQTRQGCRAGLRFEENSTPDALRVQRWHYGRRRVA